MKNLLRYLLFTIIFFSVSCIENTSKHEKRKIGSYFIEGNFSSTQSDSLTNGEFRYYDLSDNLIKKVNIVSGKKEGTEVNYYSNKFIKDSGNYNSGFRNGFFYTFDSLGKLRTMSYHYFGLQFGPSLINGDSSTRYFFEKLDHENIVDCEYNINGELKSVKYFKVEATISTKVNNTKPMLEMFFYLPHPPQTIVGYKIGITNDKFQDKYLLDINNSPVFKDTLLPYPPEGWYYFISAHIMNKKIGYDKVFIETLKHW
ncbi:MAG: hypothetical protein JST29_01445 [Bacteroidetes bacterium]|nr:hypothetical protein [Bacteroidota bacterium]